MDLGNSINGVNYILKQYLIKLHKAELEILVEIDRICRINHINYFLDSGTALGAIRHKGFIPWDDDIDIGMLRKDYKRFIEVAKEQLGDEFFLQTIDTDPFYNKLHAKVRKNNTLFMEDINYNRKMNHGIFIDIFPFDNVPNFMGNLYIKINQFFQKLASYVFAEGYEKISNYKVLMAKFVFGKNIQKRFDILCELFNKYDTKYVTSFSYINREQLLYEKKWFDKTEEVDFGGKSFFIMKGWDGYLKKMYGKYMELPPEDERYTHEPIKVNFGE